MDEEEEEERTPAPRASPPRQQGNERGAKRVREEGESFVVHRNFDEAEGEVSIEKEPSNKRARHDTDQKSSSAIDRLNAKLKQKSNTPYHPLSFGVSSTLRPRG